MVSVPLITPATVGEKVRSTMHVELVSVLGQSSISLKPALAVMLAISTGPLLVSVTDTGKLVVVDRLLWEHHARKRGIEHRQRIDLADQPVAVVGDVDVARGIHAYACRLIEFGARGRDVILQGTASSGDGVNHPFLIHKTHAVVAVVGDENVANRIDSNPLGIRQGCFKGENSIALISGRAIFRRRW